MRKKTIKIFYSWQDDTDNKLNRLFIKDCLESALRKINKTAELEEANRPKIKLDHDTKDIPGIPDIANTILQKISKTDIFIADLTFVSDYKNHKGAIKKISNQNVIFELGFAFNVIGPQKIICIFNEAFGKPQDLLFDLQNRRWPITFNLIDTESPAKKSQKDFLTQKIEQAILSITKNAPLKHGKSALHNPFSATQHNDFEYLYSKLNFKMPISIEYQEKRKDHRDYDYDAPKKPWHQKRTTLNFLPALINFIEAGNGHYNQSDFHIHLRQALETHNFLPDPNDYYCSLKYSEKEIELALRTHALISSLENKFLQKIYKFIHWLDFNGYKDTEIKIEEL